MKTNPKKNGGFTLVELIVVIAILAILAAVAIPAYSGYIEKAEKANDLQLLGAINTAFAAACMDNGFSQYDVKGAMIPVAEDGTIGNGEIQLTAGTTPSAPKFIASLAFTNGTGMTNPQLYALNVSFALFFDGNDTTAFKTFKNGLFYSPLEGGFVAMEDYEGDVTVSYKGFAFTISTEDASKLTNSTFGEIGASELLDEVSTAANVCAILLGEDTQHTSALYQLVYNNDYMNALATSLGTDAATLMTEMSGMTADDRNQFVANSLVLSAAGATSTLDTDSLLNKLAAGEKVTASVNSVDEVAQTAALFALYTAYTGGEGKTSLTELNAALGTTGFQDYVKKNGTQDMEAYKAAMSTVNQVSDNSEATRNVLTNGFSDEELNELLGAVMGNGTSSAGE